MFNMGSVFNKVLVTLTVLVAASCVWSADVAPLYFESLGDGPSVDSANQQKYWDELMKYKMFGAHGIYFMGQKINIPDESGWFGTAAGDFDMSSANGQHTVGGPIMIGGDIVLSNGKDTLSSGPVRVLGNVRMGYSAWPNSVIKGNQCVQGTVANEYSSIVEAGKGFFGANYANCPTAVPQLNDDLRAPAFKYDGVTTPRAAISINNGVAYIDVPKGSGMYDVLLEKITFSNNAELVIRMPSGGRLTRIFLRDGIEISGHPKIRVQYMSKDAVYDDATNAWTSGTATSIENKDYSGNLLFYMTTNLAFPAITSLDSIQGTFISTQKISIEQHMTLAGQLLADVITINSEFDGSGFRYVPFDPPILDPKMFTSTEFKESNELETIGVKLSKETKVEVTFRYCFDLAKKAPVDGMTEDRKVDESDFVIDSTYKLYICGKDTGKVIIPANDSVPTEASVIKIKVALDPYLEVYSGNNPKEILRLQVIDLQGAVMEDNTRDGFIDLDVIDVNVVPTTRDTLVTVAEDDTLRFDSSMFPYSSFINSEWAGVQVDSIPSAGTLTYFGNKVKPGQVIPVDSLSKLIYVGGENEFGTDTLNKYNSFLFSVVDANGGVSSTDKKEGSKVITINVTPVNDAPIAHDTTYVLTNRNDGGVLTGSIRVEDVDDSLFTYAFDSSDSNFALIDSLFTIDPETGVVSVKEGVVLAENEYVIKVVVSDKSETTGKADDIKSSTITLTMLVGNQSPVLVDEPHSVKENSTGGTVVDTLKATDIDGDTEFVFSLVGGDTAYFEVSKDGIITVKDGVKLDREQDSIRTIKVKVSDLYGGVSEVTDVVIKILDNSIKITVFDNTQYPDRPVNGDTIFTNVPDMKLFCSVDGGSQEECPQQYTLVDGCKTYVERLDNMDDNDADSVVVCYSSATPIVTVEANPSNKDADNIFTVVEEVDAADTNVYVNKKVNDIVVTITDPSDSSLSRRDTVKLDLDKAVITVPADTYKSLTEVTGEKVMLDIADSGSTKTPVNGTDVKVSYTTKVKGKELEVSYLTDEEGNVLTTEVVDEKGEVSKVEVITLSYKTVVGKDTVVVSYQANGETGEVLYVDANGGLITAAAAEKNKSEGAGLFAVTSDFTDANGKTVTVSYFVDSKGTIVKNSEGNIGYSVSYTYENKYGNAATQSVFVVLDQVGPKVKITKVDKRDVLDDSNNKDVLVVRSNYAEVEWTVNGVVQDTLKVQGLKKGPNFIVRFYKDKAGNESADTVKVIMMDAKGLVLSVEQPVTMVDPEKVKEYYAENPPEKGQTFAISIRNPITGKEVETKVGGEFKTKDGSGKEPYPGMDEDGAVHLGPTLAMDVQVPIANGVGGLATLDDIIAKDGKVAMEGVEAKDSWTLPVESYIEKYCKASFKDSEDRSQLNLYDTELRVKIWIYTTLGNFVDSYSFTQELNDPSYTDASGMLQLFFELKPDKNGDVRDKDGKLLGTGAYVYKVEAKRISKPYCVVPPIKKNMTDGEIEDVLTNPIRSTDDLLKSFGYKRPVKK